MKATKFSEYLQSREELKFVDSPHWIYVIEAAIISVAVLFTAFFVSMFIENSLMTGFLGTGGAFDSIIATVLGYSTLIIEWGAILFVLVYFINRVIYYLTTYIFASDRRLYLKTGLIHVRVKEISFDEIRATHINYGLFGRFLGYGKLMMDARFVSDADLPFTYNPEIFGKLIHYDNDLVDDVNLSLALGDDKERRENDLPKFSQHGNDIVRQNEKTQYMAKMHRDHQKDDANDEALDIDYVQNKDKDADKEFGTYTRDNHEEDDEVQRPAKRVISRTKIS